MEMTETENNGMLSFLGTQLLNKSTTTIYMKPTNTGRLFQYKTPLCPFEELSHVKIFSRIKNSIHAKFETTTFHIKIIIKNIHEFIFSLLLTCKLVILRVWLLDRVFMKIANKSAKPPRQNPTTAVRKQFVTFAKQNDYFELK